MRKVGAGVLNVKSETGALAKTIFLIENEQGLAESRGGKRDGKKSAFQWENPGEVQTLRQ